MTSSNTTLFFCCLHYSPRVFHCFILKKNNRSIKEKKTNEMGAMRTRK